MANDGGISPGVAAMGAASINALGGLAINAAKNKKQWRYQQKAMELQKQMNLEAWNMQNAYNTPTAQMQRLQDAGLNPRLIYGSGASAPNMAGNLEVPEAPVRQATGAEVPDLLTYYQVRQMDAQYRQTNMATDVMQKKAALADIEAGLKNLDLMREGIRSKNYSQLAGAELFLRQFTALRAQDLWRNEERKGQLMDQLGTMRSKQITSIDLDNAFKAHRNELAKLGIYQSDHAVLRVLIQASKRMGIDLGELLAEGANNLKYLFDLKK